jgi:hypothetical protein
MDAPAPPQADVFARCFRRSRQHRIIVCVQCRTAVVPKYAAAHLARDHGRTTKEERRHVQRYVDGLEDIAHSVSDVSRVVNNQSTQLGALELSCLELNEVQLS